MKIYIHFLVVQLYVDPGTDSITRYVPELKRTTTYIHTYHKDEGRKKEKRDRDRETNCY